MSEPTQRNPLTEQTCRQFAYLALLERIISESEQFQVELLDREATLLEPLLDAMMGEDLIAVGDDDRFAPTTKGRQAYQTMLHQQHSYLAHFEVYAAVDLSGGEFGDADHDDLETPTFTDLRVAVAEYKGMDPYRMVFLSMLADGSFFQNPGWKFDIALGSSFFKEMEEIVRSQIDISELGYTEEDGEEVSGEAVLEDIILQGARVNRERLEAVKESEQQENLFQDQQGDRRREDSEDGGLDWGFVPYDPFFPMAAYMGSALFIESVWLSGYW